MRDALEEEVIHYKRWCNIFIACILAVCCACSWLLDKNQQLAGHNLDLTKQVEALKQQPAVEHPFVLCPIPHSKRSGG